MSLSRKASSSSSTPNSSMAKRRRASVASSTSSSNSGSSSLSVGSQSSVVSSGASVGSWDPMGRNANVFEREILVNDEVERVPYWYDNDTKDGSKPLPGQHRLRSEEGQVITQVKAKQDRELKKNLRFIGLTGKKNRQTFETIKDASHAKAVPDYSLASRADLENIERREQKFTKRQRIIVDGQKVKPPRYWENIRDHRPAVHALPGQAGVYCWTGNHALNDAEWDTSDIKPRLERYVGYQERGNRRLRAFRTASYDDKMGGTGRPVNFGREQSNSNGHGPARTGE